MDRLKELILTFDRDDQREFRSFINRHRSRRKRKDLVLFKLLAENKPRSGKKLVSQLYPESKNTQAYHALRKRLFRHLMDFLVMKRLQEDTTDATSVMGLISVSRYLFDKKRDQMAWYYLKKAEKSAKKNALFDLLHTIYNLQVENADSAYAPALPEIIKKRENNKTLADEEERANLANSLIHHRLNQFRKEGQEIDFDWIIQEVTAQFQLSDAVVRRPKLLYNMVSISRQAVVAKKDYYSFEPYLIRQYKKASRIGFEKKDHKYKLGLLYMVAHVLYRNKKFKQAQTYLEEMHKNLFAYKKSYYWMYYPKYALLLAAVHSFSGMNQKAIKMLQEVLKEESLKLDHHSNLNVHLNLAVYHFQQKQSKEAAMTLRSIFHTDKWCEKVMGREWVLKKQMIELVIQAELGKQEVALYRLRSVERSFSDLFETRRYKRVKGFLKLIREAIEKPEEVTSSSFQKKVEGSIQWIPSEQEDLQAMAFYGWLKSKMQGRDYYPVLLELVNG